MKRTILVTGSAGFIGSHAVEKLLDGGHKVIGLDNFDDFYDPAIKRDNIRRAQEHPDFMGIAGDIREDADLDNIFSIYDITDVIHLAARAGVRRSWEDPLLYEQVNVIGTIKLLQKSAQGNVRHFIYGSSSSVYGINEDIPFAPEHTTQRTISPYAASKLAAEGYVHAYHRLAGFKATVLRFFTVYGPRQRPEMAIHKFARLMEEGRPVPIFGDGESSRDYTYIDDIITGLAATLDRKGNPYEILNLGSTHVVKLNDLVQIVARAIGLEPTIEMHPEAPGDVPITYADISRSRALLGFEPGTTVEEGVPRFVEWFREKRAGGVV
jgi:UDP-glucuronate 4-epimerase